MGASLPPLSTSSLSAVGGALSLRERLRRGVVRARSFNPLNALPWTLPAAWAQSTAYLQGDVVSANGYWWVCTVSGTSLGTGTGPSTPDVQTNITDNTAGWQFFSPPVITANDLFAPTVIRSSSAPSAPNNIPWKPVTNQAYACFRAYGGYPRADYLPSIGCFLRTFDAAAATPTPQGGKVGFWSDAPKPTFGTGSSSPAYRISVDGRYVTPSGWSNGSGEQFVTLDWTSVGGRKARYYEIEGLSRLNVGLTFQDFYTDAASSVWAPSSDDDIRAVFISDSQLGGSAYSNFVAGAGVAESIAKHLGWSDPWSLGIGATGYIANNAGANYTYGQRVAEALTRNPDLWVFFGSTNDNGQSSAAITAAALACYQSIRAGGSKAPIIVFGVLPINTNCPATETAVQAAVTQFADSRTYFIPLSNATPFPTIIGSYNRPAALNSAVNSFAADIGNDNVHLLQRGIVRHSRLMADLIRTQVYPLLVA